VLAYRSQGITRIKIRDLFRGCEGSEATLALEFALPERLVVCDETKQWVKMEKKPAEKDSTSPAPAAAAAPPAAAGPGDDADGGATVGEKRPQRRSGKTLQKKQKKKTKKEVEPPHLPVPCDSPYATIHVQGSFDNRIEVGRDVDITKPVDGTGFRRAFICCPNNPIIDARSYWVTPSGEGYWVVEQSKHTGSDTLVSVAEIEQWYQQVATLLADKKFVCVFMCNRRLTKGDGTRDRGQEDWRTWAKVKQLKENCPNLILFVEQNLKEHLSDLLSPLL